MDHRILICCILSIPTFAWALKCYRCEGTASECDVNSKNVKVSVIDCTQTSDRCFIRAVKKPSAEDEIEQGCTNQETCDIQQKSCNNTDDCISRCCDKDKCNDKAAGIQNLPGFLLLVTMSFIGTAHYL